MSSSNLFEIQRWDSIIVKNENFPHPMIYITITDDLLKFADKSGGFLKLRIKDCGMEGYSVNVIEGVFNQLASGPSPRPVMQAIKNYGTITLNTLWYGYPSKNGTVEILEFVPLKSCKDEDRSEGIPPWNFYKDYKKEDYEEEKCKNMDNKQLLMLFGGLLFIFTVLEFTASR